MPLWRAICDFVFRWFFAIMCVLCVVMTVLAVCEVLPRRSWKDSPSTYVVMAGFWACAFLAERHFCKPREYTPEEKAEMWAARTAEVKAWLVRRLSFDEALQLMEEGVEFIGPARITWNGTAQFEHWYSAADTSDTELWLYDTGEEAWENLAGEWGFALIRDEEIIDIMMIEEN